MRRWSAGLTCERGASEKFPATHEYSPEKPGTATDVLEQGARPNEVFLEAWSYDFFLAHAGPDAATAERLYDLLARKTRVFLDSKSIDLGEDWDRLLAEAQRRSRATVVLVSAHTDAASYQREEIATAIAPGAQGRGAAHCSPGLPATRHPRRATVRIASQAGHGRLRPASNSEGCLPVARIPPRYGASRARSRCPHRGQQGP